jgi:eukaryotic translation initiation factor 2C
MPPRAPPPSGGAAARTAPVASHVQTIGVRRGAPGQSGQPVEVLTNHFRVKIPTAIISHYDGKLSPSATDPYLQVDIMI